MTAQKPVYSRPSDDEPTPAPKRKRHRKRKRPQAQQATTATTATTTQECGATPTTDHSKRNRRTHQRAKQRARELRDENELLHRRLAAIYDALSLD